MTIAINLRSAEVKLVEMLNTKREPEGWQAVHFHLSDLLEQYKSEYQIKIAVNLINDLLKSYEGGIFLLQDHSIVVLCDQLEKTVLNKLVFQLRYLYMDDPLAYTDEGHENPGFCTIFELARDWQRFFDICTRRMAASMRAKPDAPATPDTENVPRRPVLESSLPSMQQAPAASMVSDNTPMPATRGFSGSLATIEQDIRVADLSQVIREQPVCTVAKNLAVRRVFDELYIHIAHLRQIVNTDVDFLSNRWLFKYLTHTLDERMLDLILGDTEKFISNPISININVETLLSSGFDAFDAAIKPKDKASIVLEIPVVDVFADITAFMVARKEMQKRGYRVCLDGITIDSFLNIDRSKLQLDLIKVQWNAAVDEDLKSKSNADLVKAVADCGSNRIILCRCDNRQAVEFGQALGISLFQGRYVDSLINPSARIAN